MEKDYRIPVTIITGFLGAGKTTLLNRIIQAYPDKKFAIIENEFGEVGIDNELVVDVEDGIFEMSNGCICCTLSSELLETLEKLLKQREKFDHILIETTGIAEPSSIAMPFLTTPVIQNHFKLDGTICLVDTQYIEDNLKDDENAAHQLSFSDLVLLNKSDLVTEEYANEVKSLLKNINPYAEYVKTINSDFNGKNLLNLNAFAPEKVEEKTSFIHHHHHHHHHHITSHSVSMEGIVNPQQLEYWLTVLLQLQGHAFYRIKGIFNFPDEQRKVIFQSVRNQSALTLGSEWRSDEQRVNRMVFIGKELNKDILEKRFKQCLLK
ncbi:GTP-binding protein [Limibacter armeniacum]|uniref:CobW family GTP-binding protein n=1 Tax=Limibacter armeniacum TaxID=466084 RepID=UPI002FE51DBF